VLRGLGAGLSVKDVAARLKLSPKTVSTYRTRILEKMKLQTNADLVRYVRDNGIGD
jgi:DNA-binding NarL/FixJ family response regulator